MSSLIFNKIDITSLLKAHQFLAQSILIAKTELEIAGTIQGFKFTYELTWKIMKRIIAHNEIQLASPREVFRQAALEGLIDAPEFWFESIRLRNLTTHTYNPKLSKEIFLFLPSFSKEVLIFIERIKRL